MTINIFTEALTIRMMIPSCGRDPLLRTKEECPLGHRGIWFYPSESYPDVRVGRKIIFYGSGNDIYAEGVITKILDSKDFPKYCSGLNDKVFAWRITKEY